MIEKVKKIVETKTLLTGDELEAFAKALYETADDVEFIRCVRELVTPWVDPVVCEHYRPVLTMWGSPEGRTAGLLSVRALRISQRLRAEGMTILEKPTGESETQDDLVGRFSAVVQLIKPYGIKFALNETNSAPVAELMAKLDPERKVQVRALLDTYNQQASQSMLF